MNKTLFFASSNQHKVEEVRLFFKKYGYEIKSLLDLNQDIKIEETGKTYRDNALIKAKALEKYVNIPIIADDSGLEISALDNFPGVYSQRWKGDMSYFQAMKVIIEKLKVSNNRDAFMISYLVYYDYKNNIIKEFEGKLKGQIVKKIVKEKKDNFGYDQIFYISEKKKTFYQMGINSKNKISHRFQVLEKLVEFLQKK